MEFPQELCQAELGALSGPRRGIRRVGGAARPSPPPPPQTGAADLAASSSAKPLCRVPSRRRRGASWAQRPLPTLSEPRGVAAGRPRRGPNRTCQLGLAEPVCLPPPALAARSSASSPLSGPGREA